jgi:hypothetical protein
MSIFSTNKLVKKIDMTIEAESAIADKKKGRQAVTRGGPGRVSEFKLS